MHKFHGTDANQAIVTFFGLHSQALPEHTRTKVMEAVARGGLDAVIETMEALYAARGHLNTEGLELLEGLAHFVSDYKFYGKGMRGAQMSGIAIRILDGGLAEEEGDPEIEAGFDAPEPATDGSEAPVEQSVEGAGFNG